MIVILLFINCDFGDTNKNISGVEKHSKTPIYENYLLTTKKVTTFGSNDINKEEYLIGRVADFVVDSEGSVYICDDINVEIKKFSAAGEYLKKFGGNKGEGPGEFIEPRRLCIDENSDLFVLDYKLKRITVFNSNGDVLYLIQIKTIDPGNFNIFEDKIFLSGFGLNKYRPVQILNKKSGELITSIGKRSKDSLLVAKGGNSGQIEITNGGKIYFSEYFPYRISKFSSKNKLLQMLSRNAPFIRPPRKMKSNMTGRDFIASDGGVRGLQLLFDEYLFVLLYKYPEEKSGEPIKQLIDIYEKNGNWLLCFAILDYFHISWTRTLKFDKMGNIFISAPEPFPHVAKYSFNLTDMNGEIILKNSNIPR